MIKKHPTKEPRDVGVLLHFLEEMLVSPIFFPFFNEDKLHNLALTPEHLGKALVSLDWSRRGHVRVLICQSIRSPATWVTEPVSNIVTNLGQHPAAAMRMYVFDNFQGVMCAYNNSLFKSNQIRPKWLAIQNILGPAEKNIVQTIFEKIRATGAPPNPADLQTLKTMRDIAHGLQAAGLSQEDMAWFDKIMNIEIFLDGKPLTPMARQELAKMFEAKRREKTLEEAEQFQILALCNAGQYIEHLRSKFKAVYPHLAVSDIAQLSKKTICQTLLRDSNVSQLNFSTSILDLVNVPKHLINPKSGLLNAKQETQRSEIEQFLMSRYGISRADFLKENEAHLKKIEENAQMYKTFADERDQAASKDDEIKSHTRGRLALRETGYCATAGSQAQLSGFKLCGTNSLEESEQTEAPLKSVLRALFTSYCSPSVPLFRNDILFVREAYTIFSLFRQATRRAPVPLSRLDQMCLFNKAELEVLFDMIGSNDTVLEQPFRQGWLELMRYCDTLKLKTAQGTEFQVPEDPDLNAMTQIILGVQFSPTTCSWILMFLLGKASVLGIAERPAGLAEAVSLF
jgi:hypothetical protein